MKRVAFLLIVLTLASGCARRGRASLPAVPATTGPVQTAGVRSPGLEGGAVASAAFEEGQASWYGDPYHGRQAASGERFDKNQMTAAHRTLPFNTWVRVENRANGEVVDVRITDRGPFVSGRIIDLSEGAARRIDMIRAGVVPVRLFLIEDLGTNRSNAPPAQDVFYVVQLGAFSSSESAQALRRRFASKYTDVYVERPTDANPLYRVRIGRARQAEAEAVARRVQQEDGVEAVVIAVFQGQTERAAN